MSVNSKFARRKELLWPAAGIVLGAALALNPFYEHAVSLRAGIAAWFVDLALVVTLSAHPGSARLGALISGAFFVVPCFLQASPLLRGTLMCGMAFPYILAAAQLLAPPGADFRARLGFFFTWMGARKIERRPRRFDLSSLLHLAAAAAVFATGLACAQTVPDAGLWRLARWFTGGIAILAVAEMVTASHDFLEAWIGISAPSLMRSPFLSTSVAEFWTKRWNVGASELVFRPLCFEPLARLDPFVALLAAFLASAVAHALLAYMALGRRGISLVCGAFFMAQPLFILVERAIKVRRWPTAPARMWTFAAFLVTSPLFVEPVIQFLNPSLNGPHPVLGPAIVALSASMIVNTFMLLTQLALCAPPAPIRNIRSVAAR